MPDCMLASSTTNRSRCSAPSAEWGSPVCTNGQIAGSASRGMTIHGSHADNRVFFMRLSDDSVCCMVVACQARPRLKPSGYRTTPRERGWIDGDISICQARLSGRRFVALPFTAGRPPQPLTRSISPDYPAAGDRPQHAQSRVRHPPAHRKVRPAIDILPATRHRPLSV